MGPPFYDPNPFKLNPNPLTSCQVRGSCQKLTALTLAAFDLGRLTLLDLTAWKYITPLKQNIRQMWTRMRTMCISGDHSSLR
jgi:hypothetical protein